VGGLVTGMSTLLRAAARNAWRSAPAAALVLVAALAAAGGAAAQVRDLREPVNDFADVVDVQSKAQMDGLIRRLQAATGDTIVVVTVPTFAPFADIREYAVKQFENNGRGIGAKGKDNGLLIVLAVNDRKVWIEVGYDLEGIVTDGFAGQTSREEMAPAFRRQAYGPGLLAGVARLAGRIAEGRGVRLEGLASPRRGRPDEAGIPLWLLILIVLLVLMVIANGNRRGRGRRGATYWGRGPYRGWNSGGGSFGGGRSGGGGGGASW
jgi:uncharacterized protein